MTGGKPIARPYLFAATLDALFHQLVGGVGASPGFAFKAALKRAGKVAVLVGCPFLGASGQQLQSAARLVVESLVEVGGAPSPAVEVAHLLEEAHPILTSSFRHVNANSVQRDDLSPSFNASFAFPQGPLVVLHCQNTSDLG